MYMHLAQIRGVNAPSIFFNNYTSLPADLLSRLLIFAIAAAGLFFFYRLLSAGFSYMSSLGDEVKLQQITKEVTNALFGLLIVICSYFLLQLLQFITGTVIL
jgi:hypothetical protein